MRPIKRSFNISGHRTSISLEAEFWEALQDIAARRACSLARIVSDVDAARGEAGLSSAVRVYVLTWYRNSANEQPPAG